MQHIAAGQIERGRDFCTPGRFGIALLFHQFRTGKAQLAILFAYALAYAAALGGTLAFAHITDRAAQGVTDCRTLHLAQCPGFLK